MSHMKFLIFLLFADPAYLAKQDLTTIRVPVPEGVDEIRYAPGRVTLKDLRHWLTLSPILSQNTYFFAPETITQCDVQDPMYTGCGVEQITLNVPNAEHGLERIRIRLEGLKPQSFPSGLSKIVDYFRRIQLCALWCNQHQILFFKTRDVSMLEASYEGAVPEKSCPDLLKRIDRVTDKSTAWGLVRHDWFNCVWTQFNKSIGDYPIGEWKVFLISQGVSEKLIVQENK